MKATLLLFFAMLTLNCSNSNEVENLRSEDCLIEADFSDIIYSNGCKNSYAETTDQGNILFIESTGDDRNMYGTFFLDNFDAGDKVITKEFYFTWDIGPEGTTSPSTQLDNIVFMITKNTGTHISGSCMVPFDDEGFVNLDTLRMSFENIIIRE